MLDVATQLATIQARIATAAQRANRHPASVRLVAVSKTVPPAQVQAAVAAGQTLFAENRVQELTNRRAAHPTLEWHLIGHLQTNKARPAVEAADLIHSVDSERVLRHLAQAAAELGKIQGILLQINISSEESKFGIAPVEAAGLLAVASQLPSIKCEGLMTMAPYGAPEDTLRAVFSGLRWLREELQQTSGTALPELSMGMSGDFEVAIAEGATLVRVGTLIFGAR